MGRTFREWVVLWGGRFVVMEAMLGEGFISETFSGRTFFRLDVL